jgi:hypothetical protein
MQRKRKTAPILPDCPRIVDRGHTFWVLPAQPAVVPTRRRVDRDELARAGEV